jgi:orotate phosphoribosyltransferase
MTNFEYFTKSGALMDGHFQLTSGLHSPNYFQCALVLQHPVYSQDLCGQMAAFFKHLNPELVIAPAVGGIVVSTETGRQLDCVSIFAERKEGKLCLRRGFQIEPGQRVLVAEDVVTTGGSVQEVIDLVQSYGAIVLGVGTIVDRSNGKVAFKNTAGEILPYFACYTQDVITWTAEDCPLCKEGKGIDKPGSRNLK